LVSLCKILIENNLKIKTKELSQSDLSKNFGNIYIQDSTTIRLPESIKEFYPGNRVNGEIKSVGKLQVIYNLSQGSYPQITLTSYNKNDQGASNDILSYIKPGDLVIRDMGYFNTSSFKSITAAGANYITRLRGNCNVFDTQTQAPIALLKLLKGKSVLKKKILLGTENKLPVWLIAIKLPINIANKRRRAIKGSRDTRLLITKEKLQLAGWDIYICSTNEISIEQVRALYKIRWQIEIVFKAWKSGLKLETNIYLHCKHKNLPEAVIWLTLLFFIIVVVPVYVICNEQQEVSIIKLTKLILSTIKEDAHTKYAQNKSFYNYYAQYETRARVPLPRKIRILA
jgi:hypothetical protein